MPQQVQPIPFFQLLKGAPFSAHHPMLIPGYGQAFAPQIGGLYTEFYCQGGGSNLNSGSDTSNTAKYTSTNGNWDNTTKIFTPTDGSNPVSAGVKPGDWMSIYIDGATVAVCGLRIGQVQNSVNGTITFGPSGSFGSSPATSATARTCKVGGAWRGPNTLSTFPFNGNGPGSTAIDPITNAPPRINLKNDVTYTGTGIAAVIGAPGITGSVVQGYRDVPGDGAYLGSASQALVNLNGYNPGGGAGISNADGCIIADIRATGISFGDTANQIFRSGPGTGGSIFLRCTAFNSPGAGFVQANSTAWFIECEAYDCCRSNTQNGAFILASQGVCVNCYSHDHIFQSGFYFASSQFPWFINCIAANCRNGHGFFGNHSLTGMHFLNCDAYNNGLSGLAFVSNNANNFVDIINCNFLKNGQYGIDMSFNTTLRVCGLISNCGFGGGTMANGKGKFKMSSGGWTNGVQILGSIDYTPNATPWIDPDNGNFTVIRGAGIGKGRSYFTQTDGTHQGTVAYPDLGAAQHRDVGFGTIGDGDSVLPYGYIANLYEYKLTFSDITAILSIPSGTLPTGLSLVQGPELGVWRITGTPSVAGTYNFTLRISLGGSFSDQTYHITILPDPNDGFGGMIGG